MKTTVLEPPRPRSPATNGPTQIPKGIGATTPLPASPLRLIEILRLKTMESLDPEEQI